MADRPRGRAGCARGSARGSTSPAFAALVGRLCAGPQPMPPVDRAELLDARTAVREQLDRAAPPTTRRAGCVDPHRRARRGRARRASTASPTTSKRPGVPVARRAASTARGDAARPATPRSCCWSGVAPTPELDALIAARRAAGLPTVLDVGPPTSIEPATTAPRLTAAARRARRRVRCSSSAPGGARHAAARALGRARAGAADVAHPRARRGAPRRARGTSMPAAPLVIGWRLGPGRAGPTYADGRRPRASRVSSTEHRDRVEVVGDAGRRARRRCAGTSGSRSSPRRARSRGDRGLGGARVDAARCSAARSLDDARVLRGGELRRRRRASCPPTRCAASTASSRRTCSSSPRTTPTEWYDALHHVLDDPDVRARRAQEARAPGRRARRRSPRRKAVVSRFMGWAAYQPRSDRA